MRESGVSNEKRQLKVQSCQRLSIKYQSVIIGCDQDAVPTDRHLERVLNPD
jgi:hypothetical protein